MALIYSFLLTWKRGRQEAAAIFAESISVAQAKFDWKL
jgi:hypothetical protein